MRFLRIKTIGLSSLFALGLSLNVHGQALPGPDPLQMEIAPDLGYIPVKHGLNIPHKIELGAATSVVWTEEDHLILFNRGPNPLMEFDPRGRLLRTWGQGDYIRPHGMRLDPQGNIWTTDVNGHTVRKMNLDGQVKKQTGNRHSDVWQGPGLIGDGSTVILPVRKTPDHTMMKCATCWHSRWFLRTPRSGSIQV